MNATPLFAPVQAEAEQIGEPQDPVAPPQAEETLDLFDYKGRGDLVEVQFNAENDKLNTLNEELTGLRRNLTDLDANIQTLTTQSGELQRHIEETNTAILNNNQNPPVAGNHDAELQRLDGEITEEQNQYNTSKAQLDEAERILRAPGELTTRLNNVNAELQLCTDLFLQDVKLESTEAYEARLQLKIELARSLEGNVSPRDASYPSVLSSRIMQNGRTVKKNSCTTADADAMLKSNSAKFWTAIVEVFDSQKPENEKQKASAQKVEKSAHAKSNKTVRAPGVQVVIGQKKPGSGDVSSKGTAVIKK